MPLSIPGPLPANGRLRVEPASGADGSTCVVVSLLGEFDMSNADRLRNQLSSSLESTSGMVVLDLGALDFADSTVLGVLVAAHRRAEAAGVTLRLAAPPPFIQRLLKITNLDSLIETFPNVASARSTF